MFDILFPVIGAILFAGGVYVLVRNIMHKKTWIKTTGKVIELNSKVDDEGDAVWAPVIKYSDQDKVSNVVHSTEYVNPCPYSVGDDIELYFSPADPSKFLIDNFMFEYFGPAIAIVLGTVFLIIGLGTISHS